MSHRIAHRICAGVLAGMFWAVLTATPVQSHPDQNESLSPAPADNLSQLSEMSFEELMGIQIFIFASGAGFER